MKTLKHIILLLLLTLTIELEAQHFGQFLKARLPTYTLQFASGNADALGENLKWHYYRDFQPTFPNADPQKWNPDFSWKNKYKNGNPALGAAYPGATTILSWSTDPYHGSNTVSRISMIGAPMVNINAYKYSEVEWWWLLVDFALQGISFGLGWHFMDQVILQDNS